MGHRYAQTATDGRRSEETHTFGADTWGYPQRFKIRANRHGGRCGKRACNYYTNRIGGLKMVTIFTLIIGFLMLCYSKKLMDNRGNWNEPLMAFGVIACIFSFCLICFKITCIYWVFISAPINIEYLKKEKPIYEKRYFEYQNIVRMELGQYPEYEKEIFASMDSKIILKYPELKTNTILIESFESMIVWKEEIYAIELEILETNRKMKLNKKYLIWL